MMNLIKRISVWGWLVVASAIFTLIGLIIYGVTSTTGYYPTTGAQWDVLPLILSLFALVIACALVVVKQLNKTSWITTIVLFAIVSLLIASFVLFVLARIEMFSDVYFLPVTPPTAEVQALNTSIAGFVFYLLSIVTIIVAAFGKSIHKQEA